MWASHKLNLRSARRKEIFTVNNYEDAYAGQATLAHATTYSDNSVFAQVGIKVGTRKVARAGASGWASARRSRTTSR